MILGVDLPRLSVLVEDGCFERRSSDGAIWVSGYDEDPLAPRTQRSAEEDIDAVGVALSALSGDLTKARREDALRPTLPCVPEDAADEPPPLPLSQASPDSGERTRFTFPFGIAL